MEKRLIKYLLKPRAYPEPTSAVKLVQTHVSLLFMTDHFVYKVKKGVDFGFLNFSTLDRRRFYCNEEIRLNRRLCPEMYLEVVEVREGPHGPAFHGEGPIIDYAVKMVRLPEERMLDRLLVENRLTTEDVGRIAGRVASFHLAAERDAEIARYGSQECIRNNWDETFQQVTEMPEVVNFLDLGVISLWANGFMAENAALFADRVRNGFIRDCDGDLHAENICLVDGVCIFDCIEFNARFRYCDTAADLAFLLMDFDYHRRSDLGDIFLDEYRAITGDGQILPLIPFYKLYRAMVRGKVLGLRLRDPHLSDQEKAAAREESARYFRLARGYCLREKLRQSLVITCGLMGTGKSRIAGELAFELDLALLVSDRVRKELANLPESSPSHDAYGEGLYTASADTATYETLLARAEKLLRQGKTVVVDATFRRRRDRLQFRRLAENLGLPFLVLATVCPDRTVRSRLAERQEQGNDPSDGRWELFGRQKEEFESLAPEEGEQIFLDTSRSINDNINEIFRRMKIL